MEEGTKSRSEGFITYQKVYNEGATPYEDLGRIENKKKVIEPVMYLLPWTSPNVGETWRNQDFCEFVCALFGIDWLIVRLLEMDSTLSFLY